MDWFVQEVMSLIALNVIEKNRLLINNRRDKEGYTDFKEDNDNLLKFNGDITVFV